MRKLFCRLVNELTVLLKIFAGLQGPTFFYSYNFPNYAFGINNGNQAFIVAGSTSRFYLVSPGLTGEAGTVSFRSEDNSNLYLRHSGYVLWLHPYSPVSLYKNDATFRPRPNKFFPVCGCCPPMMNERRQ